MRPSKMIGLVVGLIGLATFAALPFLIPALFYAFANVYAIITGTDFSSDTINVGVLFTGLVVTVAIFVVAMAVAVNLVGRSLSPKRRDPWEDDRDSAWEIDRE
jgi:membrane protein implicated in regulation of membrane protease activity